MTEIAARMGHKNAHTTASIYAHAMPGTDKKVAQQWEEYQQRELDKALIPNPPKTQGTEKEQVN
jgi:hypothetical protein